VATGSVSGSALVRQSGVSSNSVSFTVITPAITSVSPTSAAAGTQVTITGSGFGSVQGSGQVSLGTSPAQVASWSDTQVVATVATGSNSGTAQVLQNGVWSNPVAFTVTGGAPHISSVNPNTGSTGTVVTIQGTGFGSSQGSGIAWIGAAQASVNSWSDTQVSATVAAGAISGVVKVQQNGLWSNALTFTVPVGSGGSQLTLNPNVISMVVSEMRSIQALDANGQFVSGLTWSSSDTTVVTLSTDDPPFLTAVAPGTATITAGSASADVTVYAGPTLPLGTVIWSSPGNSTTSALLPAVPSPTGAADVFAVPFDGGTVQAITTDGVVAWNATISPSTFFNANIFFPDFQGGLDVWSGTSIYKLDGLTGQPYPAYNATSTESQSIGFGEPAIHTDGTIFTIDYACAPDACGPSTSDTTDGAWIVGVDPATGTPKFRVPTENWTTQVSADTFCSPLGGGTVNAHSFPANPMTIAGDGFAYTSYISKDSVEQRKQAATEPFPVAAYTYFDALQMDTLNGNFGAALNDLGSLESVTGLQFNAIRQDLQNGDQFNAINDVQAITFMFRRLCDSTKSVVTKLHLLRVGSDGSSSDAIVNQWKDTVTKTYAPTQGDAYNFTQTTAGPGASVGNAQFMITNADQGGMLSWQLGLGGYCLLTTDSGCTGGFADSSSEFHLTTSAGGSVASDAVMNQSVAGQYAVLPVLQLQDGSYVGQALSQFGTQSMIAFDASGNTTWTNPGYNADAATADGGIIADTGTVCTPNGCGTGPSSTFDASGAATGQLANLPNYRSWLGYGYQFGPTAQLAFNWPHLASTFAALSAENQSQNGTSVQQEWFPQLDSCLGAQTPCPREAVWDALKSLRSVLSAPCPTCSQYVFTTNVQQFGNNSGTKVQFLKGDQQAYLRFVSQPPLFFDGNRSNLRMDYFECGNPPSTTCAFGRQTVSEFMGTTVTAISQTPSRYNKMISFFAGSGPAAICKVPAASRSGGGTLNMATVFHEAMHGQSGLMDLSLIQPDLLSLFGLDDLGSTEQLSFYLLDNVLGGGAHSCGN